MQTQITELANELWKTIAKTKALHNKFVVNGFVHVYRKVGSSVYLVDESLTITFLSEPMNF